MRQDDAKAYFHTNQGNTAQCFAVTYKQEKKDTTTTYHSQGEEITVGEVLGGVWSTNKVCAYINDSGKIVGGKIYDKNTPAPGTSLIKFRPQMEMITNGSGVVWNYCDNGGERCTKDSVIGGELKTKSFFIKDYTTFYDFAKAVNDFAQDKYSNATKEALKDKDGNEISTTTDEVLGWDNDTTDTDDGGKGCRSGGAKALGWIVCPIIEWAGDAATDVYNEYVEPSLNIEPQLFDSDKNGGALQQAWGTFRDIANIIFVILLLTVIFSQLTGVGIDNYGIKRILPKLIVAAVLINLSYFLCIMAVDISNILGNSFQALFDGLGVDLSTNLNIPESSVNQEIASTAGSIVGLSVLGALAGMTGAIWATPAVILSLLIGAVGVVVAIFFLFILLAAREAAIIVLIVIAPVAVVLYALPNTKKIFDKWLALFKGLLLVYPIAGLLVGGGDYVSALLLAVGGGDSFFSALTAMVVGVLPIFFIPTVLRSAFSAMGNLGARIAGFGDRARSGVTGAIRKSQGYQNAQDNARMWANRKQAGIDGNVGKFGKFIRGGSRGMGRARMRYLKDQKDYGQLDNINDDIGFAAAGLAQEKRNEAEAVDNYMTYINNATRNGENEAKVNEMFDQYMKEKNKAGAIAAARIAGRRKDTAANFAGSKLTGKGATRGYDQSMLQSVAKEVATGENSGNYRASAPLAFEFASQINKSGVDENGNLNAEIDYDNWTNNSSNIKDALDHHVTNSSELVGMKNSSLGELATMMKDGKLDDATMARMQKLASETIANRGKTGVWDSTKEENIYKIAGMSVPNSESNTGGAAGANVVRDANGRVVGEQTEGGLWLR